MKRQVTVEAEGQWALRSGDRVPIQAPFFVAGGPGAGTFLSPVSSSVIMTPNSLGYWGGLKETMRGKLTAHKGKLALVFL